MKKITESLDYGDLEGILLPFISIDEYSASLGKDCDVITLAFVVNSKQAGEDLAGWFEKGYDWVLDSQVSNGELTQGKYLVFVELPRRIKTIANILEMLSELDTLTGLSLSDWTIKVEDEEYDADAEVLMQVVTTSPHEYREKYPEVEEPDVDANDGKLNEMRASAGLPHKNKYVLDAELKAYVAAAGL